MAAVHDLDDSNGTMNELAFQILHVRSDLS